MSSKWPVVPLEQVLIPISRPEPVDPEKVYNVLGAHWYAKGLYVKDKLTGGEIRAQRVYRVQEGDFVYNRLFAWKGSFALATEADDGCYVSNEFPCFQVNAQRVEARYLWRYFSREPVWTEALGLSTGGTPTSRNRLKEEAFLAITIPLPPLDEQRRLVERIEALAAKIEEAKSLRGKAAHDLRLLSACVVNALLPPGCDTKPLRELIEPGSSISYGVLVPGVDEESGVPFVRIQDLHPRNPPEQPSKKIAAAVDAQYRRTRLQGTEVLVAVVGATIGKVGIVPQSWIGANIARAVCRIVPGDLIDRKFLVAVLLSRPVQDYFRETTRTLAQPTLNVGQLQQTPIPILPLAEQRVMLSHLDKLESRLRATFSLQEQTGSELDAFLPAILDRAFKGEL